MYGWEAFLSERDKLQDLFERKIVEHQRVYGAQRDAARLLGERGEIQASIARAKDGYRGHRTIL